MLGACNFCYVEGLKTGHYSTPIYHQPEPEPGVPHYGGGRRAPNVHSHVTREQLVASGHIRPWSEPPVTIDNEEVAKQALRYAHARGKLRKDYRARFPVPDCLAGLWEEHEDKHWYRIKGVKP